MQHGMLMLVRVNIWEINFKTNKYKIIMEEINEVVKMPIAPSLRKMNVNDWTCYPIERYDSVNSTVQRIGKQLRRSYSIKTNNDFICVTRTR